MTSSSRNSTLFLGEPMDAVHYDDDLALTVYLWRHYIHLMSALERRVGIYSVPIVSDSPMEKARRLYEMMEVRDGHVPDADVWNAIHVGLADFRGRAARRVLRECKDEVIVNRCHECRRLARTPMAQQCLWCGHTWRP